MENSQWTYIWWHICLFYGIDWDDGTVSLFGILYPKRLLNQYLLSPQWLEDTVQIIWCNSALFNLSHYLSAFVTDFEDINFLDSLIMNEIFLFCFQMKHIKKKKKRKERGYLVVFCLIKLGFHFQKYTIASNEDILCTT